MNDAFISADEIKLELKEIDHLGESLSRNLSLLSQKIKYIISRIKSCESIGSARKYFNLLDEIHSTLCKLVFSEEIGIPDCLRSFISDFDNLEGEIEYLFGQIKSGHYKF